MSSVAVDEGVNSDQLMVETSSHFIPRVAVVGNPKRGVVD